MNTKSLPSRLLMLLAPRVAAGPQARQAAILTTYLLALAATMATSIGLAVFLGDQAAVYSMVPAVVSLLVPIAVLRLTSSTAIALWAYELPALLLTFVGALFVGGADSLANMWFPVPILLAFLAGGRRSGVGWGIVAAALVLTIQAVDFLGWLPPQQVAQSNSPGLYFGPILIAPLVMGWAAESQRESAEDHAERRRADLEKANGELVVLNGELAEARREAEAARHLAEGEAQSTQRFLAVMSHEVRTPMNGVLGMAELLGGTELDARQREQVEVLEGSAQALLTILDDVLDYSKREAGAVVLESLPVDLVSLCHQVAMLVRPKADANGTEVLVEVEPGVPAHVSGDPTRLRQVLLNLLSNAVKFTADGRVTLRIGGRSGAVCIEVQDTGVGIAADRVDKIFEPFVQADASTRRRFGGTGLGLAITRRLVDAMEGSIAIDSVIGEGSTFRLELPLVETRPQARTSPAHATVPEGLLVLVVDDNATNLLVARRVLESAGVEVVTADSGEEAIACVQRHQPAVVLMDLSMPGMDGWEATRRIRSLKGPLANVPVLALTAHALPEIRARAESEGMQGYVTKPISRATLFDAIGRALAGDRRQAS